jgi:hypothetical protein
LAHVLRQVSVCGIHLFQTYSHPLKPVFGYGLYPLFQGLPCAHKFLRVI